LKIFGLNILILIFRKFIFAAQIMIAIFALVVLLNGRK